VDKLNWYQSILDAVPFPIHVLDKDMNWVFLNKAFEKLMVANRIIGSRKDAPGMPCSSADANICKTENCGVKQLNRGIGESHFDWHGQNCKQDTSRLVNIKGEHVGYVEVVQDLTSIVRDKDYTAHEVDRLAGNLTKLAQGDFSFDLELKEADLHTADTKKQFEKINQSLIAAKDAVDTMAADAHSLVESAFAGELSTRANASRHQGVFQNIVKGFNETLDAILLPIGEGNRILAQISDGKIDELIAQTYKGDHEKMKQAVNNVAVVLQSLQKELVRLTEASREGLLSERGKPEQFKGAYAEVVGGVNQMLDAILLPIGEGNRILAQISGGKIDELIAQTYKGDHEKMKQAVNNVAVVLQSLTQDTNMLVKAALDGKLSTRADASRHHGDFRKIVEGVNAMLDAVVGPMQDVSSILNKLAGGDFTATVTSKYSGDYDLLVGAVNTVSQSVRSALEQIGHNVASLSASAEELNKVSQSMGSSADETATQASVVSAAAEQVSNNVQTVATGADEMSASIKEIAKNTAEATRVAASAVRTAETTNVTISKLGQSSTEIGQVIKVITSIAQQTNLLALNATIEAARAGEAGKGFAVVANEVKELAKETAKATEDISRKIEAIQGDTNGAVSAISQISQVIGQISDIQTTIASAIEEQSATTNEIGRTLAEAAKGSTDISKNIGGVAEAAHATTVGATETSKSAQSLEKMSNDLRTLISQFRF
jgi:methyl-accepting chemotaxis protein